MFQVSCVKGESKIFLLQLKKNEKKFCLAGLPMICFHVFIICADSSPVSEATDRLFCVSIETIIVNALPNADRLNISVHSNCRKECACVGK